MVQDMDDQKPGVIGFYNRRWGTFRENYALVEKEAYAVVLALEHFRVFVTGYTIHVFVDQASLRQVLLKSYPSKNVRYRDRVSMFQPWYHYIPGSLHPADWNSRFGAFLDSPVEGRITLLDLSERADSVMQQDLEKR